MPGRADIYVLQSIVKRSNRKNCVQKQDRWVGLSTPGFDNRRGRVAPSDFVVSYESAGGDGQGDSLGGQRQLGEANAGGVVDGVGQCGRRRHDWRLADTPSAERTGGRRNLDDDGLDV